MSSNFFHSVPRKLLLYVIFLFLILCPFTTIYSQKIDPVYLKTSDGLCSSNVQAVYQDSYGFLWIGTVNGLQKYDGSKFETYKNNPQEPNSIPNNTIFSISEDANQNLWVGTDMGISRFDRKKRNFKNYNIVELFGLTDGACTVFRFFVDSQKQLWANIPDVDLIKYNRDLDTWERAVYDLPDFNEARAGLAFDVAEDSKGGLWMGSRTYGLLHSPKNGKGFTTVDTADSEIMGLKGSLSAITNLFIDQDDIVWITTRDGVFKYNPKNRVLKTIQKYTDNLVDFFNYFNDIAQDHEGNVWVANNFRGILKFKGISDQFEVITVSGETYDKNAGSLTCTGFIFDKSGILWIGTQSQGLLKYDPEAKPFIHYKHVEGDESTLVGNNVSAVFASEINPGKVFVGTVGSGISILDEKDQNFTTSTNDSERNDLEINCFAEHPDGRLFIGTWRNGIIEYDKNLKEQKQYVYDSQSENSISSNSVLAMERDDKNNLWVGTSSGLNYFNTNTGTFTKINSVSNITYNPDITAKIESAINDGAAVVAILGIGDHQDLSKSFKVTANGNYLVFSSGEGTLAGMYDFAFLTAANSDTIWTARTYKESRHSGGALKNRIQIQQVSLKAGNYVLHYKSDDSHSSLEWNDAAPDQPALYGTGLIEVKDQKERLMVEKSLQMKKQSNVLSGDYISALKYTGEYLWVCTSNAGLNRIDLKTNAIKIYQKDQNSTNTIYSNSIIDLAADRDGMLWIATETGLDKFDPSSEIFRHFGEKDGLISYLLSAVVLDGQNNLWICGIDGLSQMTIDDSLKKVTFTNYNSEDGLGGNIFSQRAVSLSPKGILYFGGTHGLNAIGKTARNAAPPKLVISDMLISNQSVYEMGDNISFQGDFVSDQDFALRFDQNNLSFEFAALDYANPMKNKYAHFLKGYDADWVYDNRAYVSYTNLEPGKYEFMVRGSNAYGIWNTEGKSLRFTIAPPWYRTFWAYAFYIFLLAIIIFIFNRSMRQRVVLREREKSREKELAQAKVIEDAYTELKATQAQLIQSEKMASLGELTAGIAHEIQNPLNFVNNFSEVSTELLDEATEELVKTQHAASPEQAASPEHREAILEALVILDDVKQNLEKITHHGKRADAIVKGMLAHSRVSKGEKVLTDINALADEYLRLSYHGLRSKDKSFNADFKTDFDPGIPKINMNPQDIGRVLLNIINNAFYAASLAHHIESDKEISSASAVQTGHAPSLTRPMVIISTKNLGDKIQISISDNGPGIPDAIKDKIFQPFFTTKPAGQGTGLGLSLSYDIVKAHGGELNVKSQPGETIFQLCLMYKRDDK